MSMRESECKLSEELRKILLPHQANEISKAVLLQNLPVYGPVKCFCEHPIAEELGLSPGDIKAINERATSKWKSTVIELNNIEQEVKELLSSEQRDRYEEFLGAPSENMPSFWWSVAVSRELQSRGMKIGNSNAPILLK